MHLQKNILVAPLNWGLGHAARCIPIIRALEAHHFTPIIASDGVALELLRKEFPHLQSLELPGYGISYGKNKNQLKWKLLAAMPKIVSAVRNERKLAKKWVSEYNLWGIISDNRFGVLSTAVPSAYITHQINVASGKTTWLSGKLHRNIIQKFDECWVPDWDGSRNLSGKLGHLKHPGFKIQYIGPLSRFKKFDLPKKYDLMVILSGPEPQRGILENQLKEILPDYDGKIVFICGKIEGEQKIIQDRNITFFNFMLTAELEQTFNASAAVLCRSGYTTIMDLSKLQKKAFFIPTPGQPEQQYLAEKSMEDGLVPFAAQENFKMEDLLAIDHYKGLPPAEDKMAWEKLFGLFERKGKL